MSLRPRAAATALALVGLALAAALGPAVPASAQTAAGPGCDPALPVVAHRAGGALVSLPPGATAPVACAVQTGHGTSESSLAVTDRGTLVYSPAQTENSMARSSDAGASWSLTYPSDEQYTALWNTDDPFVISDRRTGRVFWTHATGPTRTTPILVSNDPLPINAGVLVAAAYGFQVYTSADDGRSFSTADYSTAPTGDWEKLAVGPAPAPSTGQPQPSGYPGIVYLCANSPLEVSGPGRLCYKSLDGGTTFTVAGFSSPTASNPADICPPLNWNVPVVDSAGTLYQPVTCDNGAYVQVSRDEGASYTWLPVPGVPKGALYGTPSLQLAVDDADTLYAMWPDAGGRLELALSHDHGANWSRPRVVSAPGVSGIVRPAIAAGAAGHVGLTYYGSTDAAAKQLSAYVTETADATDVQPLYYSGALNDTAHPIYEDAGLTGGSPRTDFVGGSFDSAGTTFWAGVVKQLGPPVTPSGKLEATIPTTGLVGRLAFSSSTPTSLP